MGQREIEAGDLVDRRALPAGVEELQRHELHGPCDAASVHAVVSDCADDASDMGAVAVVVGRGSAACAARLRRCIDSVERVHVTEVEGGPVIRSGGRPARRGVCPEVAGQVLVRQPDPGIEGGDDDAGGVVARAFPGRHGMDVRAGDARPVDSGIGAGVVQTPLGGEAGVVGRPGGRRVGVLYIVAVDKFIAPGRAQAGDCRVGGFTRPYGENPEAPETRKFAPHNPAVRRLGGIDGAEAVLPRLGEDDSVAEALDDFPRREWRPVLRPDAHPRRQGGHR